MREIDVVGPQLAVLLAAGAVLAWDALAPRRRAALPWIALAGLAGAAAWTTAWAVRGDFGSAFEGTFAIDAFSVFFQYVFAGVTAIVVIASIDWVEREGRRQSEYYALVLTASAGLMFLAGARDLITIFLALELSSIPQYVLAGWGKDRRSGEAGVKYLLLGAIASALLLYGMALLYGFSGSTLVADIAAAVAADGAGNRSLLTVATVLLIAGFGFKMAVVPFQMWVPDVYQGAPTPVAAFLSVGSKAAAFAVVMRLFFEGLGEEFLSDDWAMIFAVVAAVSMTLGNVLALAQRDIKRMLGYSSVAQAGNFLIGLAAIAVAGERFVAGAGAVLLFVAAYAFTNLGAFIAVIAISRRTGSDEIASYAGLWRRAPLLALALAFCLVSLAGIPPTAGFWAKLYVFNAGLRADLLWLVIVGVLNSAVSAYYYLAVVRRMFLGEAADEAEGRLPVSPTVGFALGVAALGVIAFGIAPMPLVDAAREAASVFAGG